MNKVQAQITTSQFLSTFSMMTIDGPRSVRNASNSIRDLSDAIEVQGGGHFSLFYGGGTGSFTYETPDIGRHQGSFIRKHSERMKWLACNRPETETGD